jgi:hypothetical protein
MAQPAGRVYWKFSPVQRRAGAREEEFWRINNSRVDPGNFLGLWVFKKGDTLTVSDEGLKVGLGHSLGLWQARNSAAGSHAQFVTSWSAFFFFCASAGLLKTTNLKRESETEVTGKKQKQDTKRNNLKKKEVCDKI